MDESLFSVTYIRSRDGTMIGSLGVRQVILALLDGAQGYCECGFCGYKGDGVRTIKNETGGVSSYCPDCGDPWSFDILAVYK